MSQQVSPSVSAAVRAASRSVTVAELQGRGIATVNSIRMGDLCSALEQAIQSTLMARRVQGDDDDTGLAAEARKRFVDLIKGENANPERRAAKDSMAAQAGRELHRLNAELDRHRADLARCSADLAKDGGQAADEDDLHEQELRRQFRRHADSTLSLAALESLVVEESLAAVRSERMRVREAELAARQSETRLLERRIEKLNHLLSETEQAMPRAETGLAAGRRDVEGLDPQDSQFQKKLNILKGVFDQNSAERGTRNTRVVG